MEQGVLDWAVQASAHPAVGLSLEVENGEGDRSFQFDTQTANSRPGPFNGDGVSAALPSARDCRIHRSAGLLRRIALANRPIFLAVAWEIGSVQATRIRMLQSASLSSAKVSRSSASSACNDPECVETSEQQTWLASTEFHTFHPFRRPYRGRVLHPSKH